MSVNPARISRPTAEDAHPTMSDMVQRLSRFDGPPEQFLVNLLAVQCYLASADGGAILRVGGEQRVEVLAVYPQPAPGSTAPVWLAQSAEWAPEVIAHGRPAQRPLHGPDDLYGQPAPEHLVMLPLRGGSGVLGLATFVVAASDSKVLAAAQQRLELTVSLLSLYEMRLTLQQRQGDLMRLRLAMETVAAVNEQERFAGAAMALCNEAAARWRCDRASLGFLKGRYVQLKAMSHTEKFSRKMQIVQDIEAAMEEALDQDVEIVHPAPVEATFVSRASGELTRKHGPSAALSLPLRHRGEVAAVLTLERPAEEPFTLDEIEALRLTCDLATPRLADLHGHDRWFGARAVATVRKGMASVVGPKHTWIKVAGIAACAAILFLVFARGTFRAEATFTLESTIQQKVPAAFEGYLKQVYVEPGSVVVGARGRPSWLLEAGDVKDWPALLSRIQAQAAGEGPSPGKRLWSMLLPETRQAIQAAGTDPSDQVKAAVLADLNEVLGTTLHDEDSWRGLEPTARQKDLLRDARAGELASRSLTELNRSLLAAAFPQSIAPGPTVLGTLETIDLRLQLKASQAERLGYLKQKAAAMAAASVREDKLAEAQIAQAQADRIGTQIELLEHRIEQAVAVSAIDGYVISGDLKRQLGAPVKTGDVLFEIASLADLRAELSVPEDLIADVQAAAQRAESAHEPLTGELATTARPDQHIDFVVERINPIAEVVDQTNVFKVFAQLAGKPELLRPGMEGVAKINIERRNYGYIWTRRLINWVRMKLWL